RVLAVATVFGATLLAPVSAAHASGGPVGNLQATLNDPLQDSNGFFGSAVSVSGDEAIVGAPTGCTCDPGRATIFERSASGWAPEVTVLNPTDVHDQFGCAAAISGDTAVVGSYAADGGGAAYVYVKGVSGWPATPTVTLANPGGATDNFGRAVTISGNTIV